MSHDCTLCLQNAVFPVRFVSFTGRPKGETYHLMGACFHLAQKLLESEGPNPEILDNTHVSVIRLEQYPQGRQINYFDTEECEHANLVRDDDVQALALKLAHRFKVSARGEAPKLLEKNAWIEIRDEYKREIMVVQDCWLKQLYQSWMNMGAGGRTAVMAFGSLALWGVQGVWEAAVYPNGRPKDNRKRAPETVVDPGKLKGQISYV